MPLFKPKKVTHKEVSKRVGQTYKGVFERGGWATAKGDEASKGKRGKLALARLGYIFGNILTLGLGNFKLHYNIKKNMEKKEMENAMNKYIVDISRQAYKECNLKQRDLELYLSYIILPKGRFKLPDVTPDTSFTFHQGWEKFKDIYGAPLREAGVNLDDDEEGGNYGRIG